MCWYYNGLVYSPRFIHNVCGIMQLAGTRQGPAFFGVISIPDILGFQMVQKGAHIDGYWCRCECPFYSEICYLRYMGFNMVIARLSI